MSILKVARLGHPVLRAKAAAFGWPECSSNMPIAAIAAIIYAQSGDKDKAIDLIAKWFAANPQQRAVAG